MEARGLTKHFGGGRAAAAGQAAPPVSAVDDVSFTIRRGETLALVGEVGVRKIDHRPPADPPAGTDRRGRVLYRGQSIFEAPPAAMRVMRQRPQIIFQDPVLVAQSAHDGRRRSSAIRC